VGRQRSAPLIIRRRYAWRRETMTIAATWLRRANVGVMRGIRLASPLHIPSSVGRRYRQRESTAYSPAHLNHIPLSLKLKSAVWRDMSKVVSASCHPLLSAVWR